MCYIRSRLNPEYDQIHELLMELYQNLNVKFHSETP